MKPLRIGQARAEGTLAELDVAGHGVSRQSQTLVPA